MLGTCDKCRGPLCVSGKQVACEACGHIHLDHPMAKAWAAHDAAPKPAAPTIPAQDYPASRDDRLARLERHVAGQQRRITMLEKELKKPEGAAA